MLKKIIFQGHWFLGISAGLILSIIGITGAIYSYEQPIIEWLNPESYRIEQQSTTRMSPAQLYKHFRHTQPEIQIDRITIAKLPHAPATINIKKEGFKRGYDMLVNPYDASVLPPPRGHDFFQFIQQLHRNLTMGSVGKQLTGACTLILIFFVFSGLYLRWPKQHSVRQWLSFKPSLKGRNFLWHLHAIVGTWVVIFYLIFACTGLYWSYDWWRSGMYQLLGVEQVKSTKEQKSISQEKQPLIDDQEVIYALDRSWQNFDNIFQREYSSLSFNIPKKNNKTLELSFVDAQPQHERAKNQAVLNYQTLQIQSLDLYENKALNKKIMSSMLPVHRGSFFGSTYQFIAMITSLIMPLFFITGWMLYLKRRKQKKLTQSLRSPFSPYPPSIDSWLIVYASQTGLAEQYAWTTAKNLQSHDLVVDVQSIQQVTLKNLQHAKHVLFIVSTYGMGDAPDSAKSFLKQIAKPSLDLSQLNYAILAFGSKDYPETYCRFGYQIDQWLKKAQAHPLFDLIDVDNGDHQAIERWNSALSKITQQHLTITPSISNFEAWTLKERRLLNPNSLGQPVFEVVLSTTSTASWQAGDIAEIQLTNSALEIQNFISHHQIPQQTWVDAEQCPIEQFLVNKDLTIAQQSSADDNDFLKQLNPLTHREYSIASIPAEKAIKLVIRQHRNSYGQLGLVSGWLTDQLSIDGNVNLRIRKNSAFHLIDDDRPMIFIGNGTGIAGLLSLLKQRKQWNHKQNWLIFGERQRHIDFFYQDILEQWHREGQLQHLDLAFSRDQEQRYYVQDILLKNKNILINWINQNAVIYICGSLQGMAQDVEQILIEILGETTLDLLQSEGRYRRDVY